MQRRTLEVILITENIPLPVSPAIPLRSFALTRVKTRDAAGHEHVSGSLLLFFVFQRWAEAGIASMKAWD